MWFIMGSIFVGFTALMVAFVIFLGILEMRTKRDE